LREQFYCTTDWGNVVCLLIFLLLFMKDKEFDKLEEVLCFDKLEACPTFMVSDRQDARPTNSSGMFRFSYSPPEPPKAGPAAEGGEHGEHRDYPRRRGGRAHRRGVARIELVNGSAEIRAP